MDLSRLSPEDRRCLSGLNQQQALEWIALKRQEHIQHAVSLGNSYNSASPVCRLPNEILLEIFRLVRYSGNKNQWLAFTWICQHWRDVALNSRGLWRDIKFYGNTAFLKACMQRSGDLSVSFYIVKPLPDEVDFNASASAEDSQIYLDFAETVDTYASRIRTLKFKLDWEVESDDFTAALFGQFAPPLSNLEVLHIHNRVSYDNLTVQLQRNEGAYPRLHTLYLKSIPVVFHVKFFVGLRHLHLEKVQLVGLDGGPADIHGQALEPFLYMLRACPLLETLELRSEAAISWDGTILPVVATTNSFSKVLLPCLKSLRVHLAESHLVQFFSHLILPPLVNTHFALWSERHFLNYLDSHLRPSSSHLENYQILDLCMTDSLRSFPTPLDDASRSVSKEFRLHIPDVEKRSSRIAKYLDKVPTLFPSLTRLIIAGDLIWVDAACWRKALKGLPNLKSIHVQDMRPDTSGMIRSRTTEVLNNSHDSLSPFFTALAADATAPMLCPDLEEVSVVVNNHEIVQSLPKLVSALRDRRTHNVPLKKLRLTEDGSAAPAKDGVVSELQSMVDTFVHEVLPRRPPRIVDSEWLGDHWDI